MHFFTCDAASKAYIRSGFSTERPQDRKAFTMSFAIIIPVHRPKSNWLMSFINSYQSACQSEPKKSQDRIVLICTNSEEASFFSVFTRSFYPDLSIEVVDIESFARNALRSGDIVLAMRRNLNGGIINYKKFLAMKWAGLKNIETYIIIDCDASFIGRVNMSDFAIDVRKYYDSKLIIGTEIDFKEDELSLCAAINRESMLLLAPEHQDYIRNSGAARIYSWYLAPPTYTHKDVSEFFSYMERVHGSFERFLLKVRWYTFDNVVYNFFRFVAHDCSMLSYKEVEADDIPENLDVKAIGRLRDRFGIEPVWIPATAAFNEPAYSYGCLPKVKMIYHCDRIGQKT